MAIAVVSHLRHVDQLLTELGWSRSRVAAVLVPYYVLTVMNASLEGIAMVILVGVFTSGSVSTVARVPPAIASAVAQVGGSLAVPGVVKLLLGLFAVNFLMRSGLLMVDGTIAAILRQKIQAATFTRYLTGDWSAMRGFRVGDAVGTCTQEAPIVAKYLSSAMASVYFIVSAAVVGGLAVATSAPVSLALGLMGLPLAWIVFKVFSVQASLSRQLAGLRNDFSGDITDRFNGLLQVHVDNNYAFHLHQGLRTQPALTRLEIWIGACSAIIGSFTLLLPLTALMGLAVWIAIAGANVVPDLTIVASIAVLGMRASGQLNGAVAQLGNLSRLSGSLRPVLSALNTPPVLTRKPMNEPLSEVLLERVSYAFGTHRVLDDLSLTVSRGAPLVLSGRSGKGKTTIANLLAGLYQPLSGTVTYVSADGAAFDAAEYRARIGFVTQDIYLFRGTLRSNLTSGRASTDDKLWAALREVDAEDFVRAMGGLDVESAEAGRSLSGGQRRRLGIARVVLSDSDLLILDEVTAGLDAANRAAVIEVINRLSANHVVVVISHDDLPLHNHRSHVL